jgi:hypothetical protein
MPRPASVAVHTASMRYWTPQHAPALHRRIPASFTPYGRGVAPGAKVGNWVAVGAGVAIPVGLCVATCACAPAKKATKPTRTHTLSKAIPDRIRMFMDFLFIAK